MYQEESIYNLIPKEKIQPVKEPLYRSKFPPNLAPTASTFCLKNSSYPNVSNMNGEINLPRGAHSISGSWRTFGLPEGLNKLDPINFIKKGHQYKTLPPPEKVRGNSELKKPAVPTLQDKPIMGLKSDKNYITANAIDVILMAPKKKKTEEINYLSKKSYGKVPEYISKLKEEVEKEYKTIREMQLRSEEEEAKKKRSLNETEVEILREGLNKKLEQLKISYAGLTHKGHPDTLVMKNKKENLEKEMEVIEKDLKLLGKNHIIIDLTK